MLLCGTAGGSLTGGTHVRAPGENLSKILFSIAQIMGAAPTRLGANEGLVESGIAGLV